MLDLRHGAMALYFPIDTTSVSVPQTREEGTEALVYYHTA
jgi:hypothetical protein